MSAPVEDAAKPPEVFLLPRHAVVARPLADWHEDMGAKLWWKVPVTEPPYVGTPLDVSWPGDHTHFTPIILPVVP